MPVCVSSVPVVYDALPTIANVPSLLPLVHQMDYSLSLLDTHQ